MFGLTSVRFRDYALGSAIAMTPTTVMEVYLGTAVKSLSDIVRGEVTPSPQSQMFFWLSIVLTLALSAVASYWVKRRMQLEFDKFEELELTSVEPVIVTTSGGSSSGVGVPPVPLFVGKSLVEVHPLVDEEFILPASICVAR